MANPKPTGRAKSDKIWRDALHIALKREVELSDGRQSKALAAIAEETVKKAVGGDMAAIKEIGDRMDGKPAQSVSLSGDKDNPITVIERTIVKASDSNG